MKKVFIVRDNETGKEYSFTDSDKAYQYQEYLVFTCGVDAEVL